jgi:hypothetical protein
MARLNKVVPIKKTFGEWEEGGGRLGLSSNFGRGTVEHELAGHGATGWAKQLAHDMNRDPKIKEAFTKLPPESKKFMEDLISVENFDYSNLTKNFRSREDMNKAVTNYMNNYNRWPGEVFSSGIEGRLRPGKGLKTTPDLLDEAKRLGHRLTMKDYEKFAKPRLARGMESMKLNFPQDYEYNIGMSKSIVE